MHFIAINIKSTRYSIVELKKSWIFSVKSALLRIFTAYRCCSGEKSCYLWKEFFFWFFL